MEYQVILFYKYITIPNPHNFMREQKQLCASLNLKGRILISNEGINGTLEGEKNKIQEYIEKLSKNDLFRDMDFKKSKGAGDAFGKLIVKVRDEIVTSSLSSSDIRPNVTGKYLSAEEFHEWFNSKKEFYIVDMRNDYEQRVGFFEGSILSGMSNFRDLPKVLPTIEHLRNKTIVTVCTGGIRCEKASGFLVENGFTDVYQLHNGIHTYMEKYPNQNFLGKLYVFDKRIMIGFNTDSPEHKVIGKCENCGASSENYVNCANDECHVHFICCKNCLVGEKAYCLKEIIKTV